MVDSTSPSADEPLPYPERVSYFCALCAAILGAWAVWAVWLYPVVLRALPNQWLASALLPRLVCWILPCAVYLAAIRARVSAESLAATFPLGASQIVRALLAMFVVALVLLVGTASQKNTTPFVLVESLVRHAQPRLTAPLFEELVFRAVLLAEALDWARATSSKPPELHRKFWAAQLFVAAFFTAIHVPYWLSQNGFATTVAACAPLLMTGLVLGLVFATTRSLWACIALHWLNNELSLLPVMPS